LKKKKALTDKSFSIFHDRWGVIEYDQLQEEYKLFPIVHQLGTSPMVKWAASSLWLVFYQSNHLKHHAHNNEQGKLLTQGVWKQFGKSKC
jgi:hypothetical protein